MSVIKQLSWLGRVLGGTRLYVWLLLLTRIYTLMDLFDSRLFLPAVDYPHDFGLFLMARISVYHLLVCWFKSGVTPTYGVVSGYVLHPSYLKRYLLMF